MNGEENMVKKSIKVKHEEKKVLNDSGLFELISGSKVNVFGVTLFRIKAKKNLCTLISKLAQ